MLRRARTQARRGVVAAAALLVFLVAPSAALGGTASGGTTFTLTPAISAIDCVTQCNATTTTRGAAVVVRPGATVRVRGSNLDHVRAKHEELDVGGLIALLRGHFEGVVSGRVEEWQ